MAIMRRHTIALLACCMFSTCGDCAPAEDYVAVFGSNPSSVVGASSVCAEQPSRDLVSQCRLSAYDDDRDALRLVVMEFLRMLRGRARAEFVSSQKLWVEARQHQCDAIALTLGQPAWDCFAEATQARTAELLRLQALLRGP